MDHGVPGKDDVVSHLNMEEAMDSPEQGYPENRFAVAVDDDLKCAICLSVLREPLQCEMNEHHFCTPCIKRHLRNNAKCPCCLDDLSLETLKKPSRYFTKHLGSLVIQCDHESRGCQEFVKLEDLARHLRECGYAPVSCQNDGCCEVVNKQDIFRHQNELCERRRTDCHNCAETKKEIGDQLKVFYQIYQESSEASRKEITELTVAFEKFREKKELDEKASKASRKEISDQLKVAFEEFRANKELDQKASEASRKEINELKVSFEELKNQVDQIVDLKLNEDQSRPPSSENVIVVVGGHDGNERLTTSEMCVWSEMKWIPLPKTGQPHVASSAVVFENQILVAGGRAKRNTCTDSIEAINCDRKPLQWCNFSAKLPHHGAAHSCIVYQNHLIVIGGCKGSLDDISDGIYEISLRPPYTCKLLSSMPSPRAYHRAELFGDKIVVIGGVSQGNVFEQSVLLFDITTSKCDEILQLNNGIKYIATVAWGAHIVVIGGVSRSEVFNTVKMFNIKTRKTYMLPPMNHKRSGCTAVVINNHIVVMGGSNNGKTLNVVECFDFATYTWTELPPMNEARSSPTSVVVPVSLPLDI